MDIPEEVTVISRSQMFDGTEDAKGGVGDFAYYSYRLTGLFRGDEEIILTNLKMHPILVERIYPTYHKNLLKAQDSILPNCYIKRPVLSTYDNPSDAQVLKNLMMAEIEVYEILRSSPHPNIAEYLGCLVMGDGNIHGVCITRYETTLSDLVDQNPLSVDIQGCVDGIRKGIEHLHSLGLAHNDINPLNVMVDNGEPVVIDFDSCVKEGGKLLKRETINWSLVDMKMSSKENDYYGLGLIEKWLIRSCQKFVTNR